MASRDCRCPAASRDLADALARAHLDIAIIAMSDDHEITLAKHLAHRVLLPWVPVFVAEAADHPLATGAEIALTDLADEDWIGPPGPEDGSLASLRAAAARAGFTPRVRYTFPLGGGRQLIAAGRAVQLVEPTAPETPGVVIRPLEDAPVRMRIVLAWHRKRAGWDQVDAVYQETTNAYLRHAAESPAFSQWLRSHDDVPLPTALGAFS
ncbi:hypothetical protein JOD54_004808 [Actinokineospora baliensis]|uniref:LysR substrate-binding domain-containing protein n=1 Tax=Actinokineospora baliensis TaxID=547056 RepID=UPI00195CADBF|nr:LysR substrate-binding domain-containing protein [Actinokineospora baliensis]MBM7774604.1 hypothetical protein [Actinokineospora baliensis]